MHISGLIFNFFDVAMRSMPAFLPRHGDDCRRKYLKALIFMAATYYFHDCRSILGYKAPNTRNGHTTGRWGSIQCRPDKAIFAILEFHNGRATMPRISESRPPSALVLCSID